MLRKMTLLMLVFMCGCYRKTPAGEHPQELVGTWELTIRSDCDTYGMRSDMLILRPDGTFEQHVTALDGRRFDDNQERWKFLPDHSLELDKRHDFFTSQNSGTLIGLPQREVLIVEFGSPLVILLNPDSNCVYKKV